MTTCSGKEDEEIGDTPPLTIAIIGGGIVGVVLAHGLLKRGVRVAVYERALNFHEIGAGFAFTGVARDCMARLSGAVIEAMHRVGVPNKRPFDNYWDGYHLTASHAQQQHAGNEVQADVDPDGTSCELLFTRPNHQLAFWGCLRASFLEQLASLLPPGVAHFDKELVDHSDPPEGPVTLTFKDGTTATADALIGCDGLRSRVRAQLLTPHVPHAVNPRYTHKRCYRAVVPLSEGERVLGAYKANNQCMHVGPGAHVLTYPVGEAMLNIVLFITDQSDWPDPVRMTAPGSRADALAALSDWGPAVRGLAALLPTEPLVWGIFDMFDHPTPWYARQRVCLLGDAAHAAAPHHGAGAGFGVEDALALATAVEEALRTINATGRGAERDMVVSKAEALTAAFQAFNDVRYERTQWLVRSSREAGEIYEWRYPPSGSDPAKLKTELDERFKIIWDFDVDKMVDETRSAYHRRVGDNQLVN
ncbi:FAD/NAD(P)-binding domain-containing protein [Viridothelium virens]|uniref:FAD/NAD(P)-binding domain-containing protein n=1 Tax=Viridothelium virens TaxID=1048519 RepID=A0A6A6HC87_VIRVR|nr:FAD/NAD(P)-binding domain-containing protein [Viridothelium virens]